MTPNSILLIKGVAQGGTHNADMADQFIADGWNQFIDNPADVAACQYVHNCSKWDAVMEAAKLEIHGKLYELFESQAGLWAVPLDEVYIIFKSDDQP